MMSNMLAGITIVSIHTHIGVQEGFVVSALEGATSLWKENSGHVRFAY